MDEKLASGGGWQPQVAGGGRKIAAKGDRMIGGGKHIFRSRVSAAGSQVQVFGFGYRFRT
jgi:hypothetical protein